MRQKLVPSSGRQGGPVLEQELGDGDVVKRQGQFREGGGMGLSRLGASLAVLELVPLQGISSDSRMKASRDGTSSRHDEREEL